MTTTSHKPLCMPTQLGSNTSKEPSVPPRDTCSAPPHISAAPFGGAGRKLGLMTPQKKLRTHSDLYEARKKVLCTIECGKRDVKNSQVLKRWLEKKNSMWFRERPTVLQSPPDDGAFCHLP